MTAAVSNRRSLERLVAFRLKADAEIVLVRTPGVGPTDLRPAARQLFDWAAKHGRVAEVAEALGKKV